MELIYRSTEEHNVDQSGECRNQAHPQIKPLCFIKDTRVRI